MGERCWRRAAKKSGCVLKNQTVCSNAGQFCIFVLSLFSLQGPSYTARGGKVPWGSAKCHSGGEKGGGTSSIVHVGIPSPCSNNNTGESEIQKI